jgi:phosphoadenosine phosphosulfate reductase
VSSFSAESAVLLALVAEIDPAVPVLFLDTGKHFAATLAYRNALAAWLGLRDVRDITPAPAALLRSDPDGMLHATYPDACCILRKAAPLEAALAPFAVWVTGRKRHQTSARTGLAFVEQVDGRTKLNPLADWTAADIAAEFHRRGLPAHPLVAQGFSSIGCAPCTRAARDGEDVRAGRWAGRAKTECGIHHARPAAMVAG